MATPEQAAQTIALLIKMDLVTVEDWNLHWEMAAYILSNQPEKAASWKFNNMVDTFTKALTAKTKAKVYSNYIQEAKNVQEANIVNTATTNLEVESRWTPTQKAALERLNLLSGKNMHGHKIMPDDDFKRLYVYVEAMIEKDGLPDGLEPIAQTNLPNAHIRYLFNRIHADLYTTKSIRTYYIDFIHNVFRQFTGNKETTRKNFSTPPPAWTTDLATIKQMTDV